MRVRFLTDWHNGGEVQHAAGDVKDIDDAAAFRFLRRGVAEDVPPEVEKKTVSRPYRTKFTTPPIDD